MLFRDIRARMLMVERERAQVAAASCCWCGIGGAMTAVQFLERRGFEKKRRGENISFIAGSWPRTLPWRGSGRKENSRVLSCLDDFCQLNEEKPGCLPLGCQPAWLCGGRSVARAPPRQPICRTLPSAPLHRTGTTAPFCCAVRDVVVAVAGRFRVFLSSLLPRGDDVGRCTGRRRKLPRAAARLEERPR